MIMDRLFDFILAFTINYFVWFSYLLIFDVPALVLSIGTILFLGIVNLGVLIVICIIKDENDR